MIQSFTVHTRPTGKARARAGKNGHYTPPKTKAAEELIARTAQAAGIKRIVGPVQLCICAVFAVTPSWSRARKQEALSHVHHTMKPDADNIAKLVTDALNKIAYDDDCAVSRVTVQKTFGPRDHLTITLTALRPEYQGVW